MFMNYESVCVCVGSPYSARNPVEVGLAGASGGVDIDCSPGNCRNSHLNERTQETHRYGSTCDRVV